MKLKQEDRQLLLKDLSARLPYNPMVLIHDLNVTDYENYLYADYLDSMMSYSIKMKPFLRPMSSMTEEEKKEYYETMDKYTHRLYPNSADFSEHTEYQWTTETFDFLNAHHLDYRGLIPMGLAIEAPKGMYNFNQEQVMRVFVRISIFIWYFISAMYIFNAARNLDKYFNTDYIGDIAISLLMSCIILRVVILEEQNKKHKEE